MDAERQLAPGPGAWRSRTRSAAWPLGVAVAALLPLAKGLLPGHTLSWRDTAILFDPLRLYQAEVIRSLRLPLWDPWDGTGQPLLAQLMYSVLHPVSIAAAILRVDVDGWLAGLVAFAALGTWLAARALGVSRAAAAGGALAYALSGYVLGMTGNALYLVGAAGAPWVVAGMLAAARGGVPGVVAAGAATAAAVLGGEPQSLVAAVAIGGALAFGAARWRGTLRAALGVACGLLLGAVQLIPSFALLARSARAAGISYASDAQWPLDPARLVELVAPGFFVGRVEGWAAPVFAALGKAAERSLPWTTSVHVGGVTVLLACVAAARRREGRILGALTLAFTWLAMGTHLGAAQLLSRVPIWGSFRYAEKLVGPLTLCLALGAAVGIEAAREAGWLRRAALALAAVASAVALLCWLTPRPAEALLAAAGAGRAAGLAREHLGEGMIHAAAAAGLLLGIVALASRRRHLHLEPALAALLFVEAAAASPYAIHAGDARWTGTCPPPVSAAAPGPRLQPVLLHNQWTGRGGLDPIDAAQERFARASLGTTNAACKVEDLEAYTSLETMRAWYTIMRREQRVLLGARFGATHVLSEPAGDRVEAELLAAATAGGKLVFASPELSAWEVPHREWASFPRTVRAVRSLEQAVSALRAEVARRSETVVVESDRELPVAPGRVLSSRREAEEIEIEAEADGDAVLVVNDAWDPGWTARIDGVPAPVMPADILVRAVPFPAGRHRVEMRYRPREVTVGLAVSLGTAALCLASLAWSRGRAARRREGTSG